MNKVRLKNILKLVLIFISFIIIGIAIDLFVFNFNVISLKDNDRGTFKVDISSEKTVDENKVIQLNLHDKYVNKMTIEYETEKDVPVTFNFVEHDYYENDKDSSFSDIFDNEVTEQTVNYRNNIKNIEIIFDKDNDITINNITIDNSIKINYFRVVFIVAIMLVLYVIYKFYKNGASDSKIHIYFLLVGLIIGSTMIILQPSTTYYSWDDQIHFMNTYELIGGDFEWKTGEFSMIDYRPVGRDSINSIEEQENQKKYLNSNNIEEYNSYSGHFISYNKISYIPSAIGFYLCKFLGLPFVICFKMGKFMNLLSYLSLMTFAIKISKSAKKLLTIIGLIPTSIFLACQYSYDPAVTGGITLGLVCLFNWILDKDSKVDFKSMTIFILSMLYGCFPKAVYAPLLLLFLFIPKDKFNNKKHCIWLKCGIFMLCILMLSTFILPTLTTDVAGDARGGNTSVTEQLKIILNNPIGYIKVLKDTMVNNLLPNFFSKNTLFFYSYVGKATDNLYLGFLIFLLFIMFSENTKINLKLKDKIIIWIAILGIILLIWTALYLSFTPIGLNTINGVQPRYFIPLLFPLIYTIKTDKIRNTMSNKFYNIMTISIPSLLIIVSLYQLFVLSYCM